MSDSSARSSPSNMLPELYPLALLRWVKVTKTERTPQKQLRKTGIKPRIFPDRGGGNVNSPEI